MNPQKPGAFRTPLLALVGPTGCGKTALAMALAGPLAGEIVNCDSLQLYRGFDVGTAKTPIVERGGIVHHLFDVLDPHQGYSAGEYARAARCVLEEIAARGRMPIVTGGTGFYLQALLDGLPSLPKRDESVRARLMARERARPGSLHRLLERLEPPAAARIHANDTQKVTRALEIRLLTRTGLPPGGDAQPLRGFAVIKIGLHPDRETLNRRLDARTTAMFRGGLIEEVRGLLERGLSGTEKPFESLGYKQALLYVRDQLTLEQAVAATQLETRQYAKRQWTWFRRDPEIFWIEGFGDSPGVLAAAADYVDQKLRLLN